MRYSVFSQSSEARVDAPTLAEMAHRHFDLDVEVLADEGHRLRLSISGGTPRRTLDVTIAARARTDSDLIAARTAELRGRAGGMAALSERCPTIWEVEAAGDDEPLLLEICALLASLALGPVLPPDHSTLFGVRGARERAQLKR